MLLALAVTFAIHGSQPAKLNAKVHWLANTSGRPENHIQNFIEDMSVVYLPDPNRRRPLVLTKSFWDEGNTPNACYHRGIRYGKNFWMDSTDSRTAGHRGVVCRIQNFYGRGFLGKNAPPPTGGDSIPFVACSDSTYIRTVVDPTAIAFDTAGNLLVADNSSDQDVKIFTRDKIRTSWTLLRTFGVRGGVFAGPVPGSYGDRKFWGIRGLGVDSVGNVYVGNTGIPMQTMGGTDIRAFSSTDTSLLWQIQGLAFVNTADGESGSDGRSVHMVSKRFTMNWSAAPGASWKLAGISLDPFRFPADPRLTNPMATSWIRWIKGKKYLFTTSMRSEYLAVFRFVGTSEIAAPCAYFTAGSRVPAGDWMDGIHPSVEGTSLSQRWAWLDRNGDGTPQQSEFQTFNVAYPYIKAIDIADDGTIMFGGRGMTILNIGSVTDSGVPLWDVSAATKVASPFTEGSADVLRMRWLQAPRILVSAGSTTKFPQFLYVSRNWSPTTPGTTTRIAIPYLDSGAAVTPQLDQNTYDMILPIGFTADKDYAYITYLDRGPNAKCIDVLGSKVAVGDTMKCRGEITVINLTTGATVGFLAPDSGVGWYAGATDMYHPLNVVVRNNGERIIFAEEDGKGKVFAYQWCPDGEACKPKPVSASPSNAPNLRWITHGSSIALQGLPGSEPVQIRVMGMDGRIEFECETSAPTFLIPKKGGATGFRIVKIEGESLRTSFLVPRF